MLDEERVEVEEQEAPYPTGEPEQTSEIRINNGDDMSDMFKPPSRDDPDMQTDDLVAVSEEDVFGEGGSDLEDLVDVSSEDIMGESETDPWGERQNSQPASSSPRTVRVKRTPRHYPLPGGMQGINR